ncbi:hypothetical protein NIES3974_36240 [Calothrix sp. NIES-3974]|nr:hypothetical protein NIES3974_36240 [Calothrix sp. NIES-3974]
MRHSNPFLESQPMLKTLLLSGWFRVQPFLKYVLVVIVIAPAIAASSHASSVNLSSSAIKNHEGIAATQADAAKETNLSRVSIKENIGASSLNSDLQDSSGNSASQQQVVREEMIAVVEPGLLQAYAGGVTAGSQSPVAGAREPEPLASVEFAPPLQNHSGGAGLANSSSSQASLIAKLKSAKAGSNGEGLLGNQVYLTAKVQPGIRNIQPILDDVPVLEQQEPEARDSEDPLGSTYPIPMNWIMATQEAIGPRGGGTRYYRSHPVVSPDGRYAVYSRVQLEVKPEMHKTRVSSVLFIEDRQTKRLQVVSSTSRNRDALIPVKVAQDMNGEGTIGVLVPVSWSKQGDRFLARRFEGVMNTSHASDYAVIWNRDKNYTRTVSPVDHHAETDTEKIAILLGWSQNQPDRVLFSAGEMGSEDWPVISVSDDGSVTRASEVDKPVTYRELSQVWAGPQVAYR